MKKLTALSMMALMALAFSAQNSFAASYNKTACGNYKTIQGTVTSTDKHFFSIKDKDDGATYRLNAWASDLASISEGDQVKVTVPQPGNKASKIVK